MLALVTERWILTETPAILVFTAQISPKAHLAPRGFAKVRYRGLAKNLARAQTMFALADLYQVRRQLLRWRRDGWSALWRYRARGRWRGGRPRISSEVRHLIIRMARENFLWGAPRIHGELLMLGFSVSQATVSRYMPARSRRPNQSWRTFLRNQAMAFGHCEYSEEWQSGNAGPQGQSYSAQLARSEATQTVWVGRKRSFGRAQSTLSNRRIRLRSAECDRGVTYRAAYVSSGSRRALLRLSQARSLYGG